MGSNTVIKVSVEGKEVSVVTHADADADGFVSAWLIESFADLMWVNQHVVDGFITVDMGNGEFDHHQYDIAVAEANANAEAEAKKELVKTGKLSRIKKQEMTCATWLVAESLGVARDPALREILDHIMARDHTPAQHSEAYAIIGRGKWVNRDPQGTYNDTVKIMNGWHRDQRHLFGAAVEEFHRAAKLRVLEGPHDSKVKLAVIITDEDKMSDIALAKNLGDQDIVILRSTIGLTQIFFYREFDHLESVVRDAARVIRVMEWQAGNRTEAFDKNALGCDGLIPGVPQWYVTAGAGWILNGTNKHLDVPPSKLLLDRIVEAITIAFQFWKSNPDYARDCANGICAANHVPCSWKLYGLPRCAPAALHTRAEKARGNGKTRPVNRAK